MFDRIATYLTIVILALAVVYNWAGVQILRKRLIEAKHRNDGLRHLHELRARSEARTLVKMQKVSEENERLKKAAMGDLYTAKRGSFGRN